MSGLFFVLALQVFLNPHYFLTNKGEILEQGNDKLELVYEVEDKPSPLKSTYAALQYLLAIIVGIITPTVIIG